MTVKVIHVNDAKLDDSNIVRIDRPSKWGNPFRLSDYNGDRDLVLDLFKEYFYSNKELQDMVESELKDKTLACWCKPKKCHGDVYAEFLNRNELFS